MAKSVAEHKDLAGNVIKVGDCLAFSVKARSSSRLGFGRVIRISPTRVAIMEAVWKAELIEQPNGSYVPTEEKWLLRKRNANTKPEHCLLVPMRSFPQEVFVMLDNLELG